MNSHFDILTHAQRPFKEHGSWYAGFYFAVFLTRIRDAGFAVFLIDVARPL